MKEELESKDSNIQDLTTNQNNLRMALDHTVNISVTQQDDINSLLRDNMSLCDENVQNMYFIIKCLGYIFDQSVE
jgi:hypothetical protein